MLAGLLKFRDLILGDKIVASRSEFKRLMLTGYMALTCIVVAFFYALVDVINQVYYAFPAYAILLLMPVITLLLIRINKFKLAKVILVVSSNLVVFWAAVHDPFETGVFMFFIPAGIGSFAILAVEDYKTGFSLAGFTTILFFVAYFAEFSSVDVPRPSDEYIRISFILNYFISLTVSVLAVYFQMNLNKQSENDLIAKEQLANEKNTELMKVNAELDRFVYSVSHDLRSPLSSILGLTNLAKNAQDERELNDILNMIQGRVKAQDHFIRDIIDYARNARTEVTTEEVKVADLVDEVFNSLRYNSNADKIEFRKSVPDNALVITDRIRLSVILSNLISNSIKYHDLKKLHPYIEITYIPETKTFSVKDNGIGIMPEHLGKIFNMFYRGSDRSTGSGLGLFITKEAVLKLGGSIEVKSVYGEGSVFTVSLP